MDKFTQLHQEVMDRAIIVWGERQQVIKAVEEMAELSQALCKWLNLDVQVRGGVNPGKVLSSIHEELADASIMLSQLRAIFPDPNFYNHVDAKLNRLLTYLPEVSKQDNSCNKGHPDYDPWKAKEGP